MWDERRIIYACVPQDGVCESVCECEERREEKDSAGLCDRQSECSRLSFTDTYSPKCPSAVCVCGILGKVKVTEVPNTLNVSAVEEVWV